MAKLGDLVTVEWLDAHAETGWGEISNIEIKPQVVLSIGWLTANNEDAVVLVADIDPDKRMDGDCNRALIIPKGMVKRIRKVEL